MLYLLILICQGFSFFPTLLSRSFAHNYRLKKKKTKKKKSEALRGCGPQTRRGPRRRRRRRLLPRRARPRRRPRPRRQSLLQHVRDVPLGRAEHPRGGQDAREGGAGAVPCRRVLRGVDREAGVFIDDFGAFLVEDEDDGEGARGRQRRELPTLPSSSSSYSSASSFAASAGGPSRAAAERLTYYTVLTERNRPRAWLPKLGLGGSGGGGTGGGGGGAAAAAAARVVSERSES